AGMHGTSTQIGQATVAAPHHKRGVCRDSHRLSHRLIQTGQRISHWNGLGKLCGRYPSELKRWPVPLEGTDIEQPGCRGDGLVYHIAAKQTVDYLLLN